MSIENLANQVLLYPNTPAGVLAPATNGIPYSFQFTGGGGQPPYTWALTPESPGLPAGLQLSSAGVLSGTPAQTGTFDFVIRLTDATSRKVDWSYTLVIRSQ